MRIAKKKLTTTTLTNRKCYQKKSLCFFFSWLVGWLTCVCVCVCVIYIRKPIESILPNKQKKWNQTTTKTFCCYIQYACTTKRKKKQRQRRWQQGHHRRTHTQFNSTINIQLNNIKCSTMMMMIRMMMIMVKMIKMK